MELQIRDFLKRLQENEQAAAIMQEIDSLEDESQVYALYARAAEAAGISVTEAELKEAIKRFEDEQKQATKETMDEVKLSADDLDAVVGGKKCGYKKYDNGHTITYYMCADTYKPGENCWFLDRCKHVICSYDWKPDGYMNV